MATQTTSNVFDNVSKAKRLPLYRKDGTTDPKLVADFISLQNQDVAKISDISLNSVRYEPGRIPINIQTRMAEIANICELVAEHFDGDPERTVLWFKSKNPILGGLTPRDMIRFGRYQKLIQILMDYKQGNIA